MLEDSIVPGYTRKSKSKGSEGGDNLFEDDNSSLVDTDITQLHDPQSTIKHI